VLCDLFPVPMGGSRSGSPHDDGCAVPTCASASPGVTLPMAWPLQRGLAAPHAFLMIATGVVTWRAE
jgi:hypothetical protein